MRVRMPSPATAIAVTALVVASGGTAIAATQLVSGDSLVKKASLSGNRLRKHTITGTQVNLKKLGKVPSASKADNAASATNAVNAANATHAGSAGIAGFATSAVATGVGTLASGRTEVGIFSGRGASKFQDIPISFPIPLASAPTPHVVASGATTTGCTGTPANPTAAAGVVCVYEEVNTTGTLGVPVDPTIGADPASSRFGLYVFLSGATGGDNVDYGSWAVTAP